MKYDVVIVGGGIGGLMSAYRLIKENPSMKICVIDKGRALDYRNLLMHWTNPFGKWMY